MPGIFGIVSKSHPHEHFAKMQADTMIHPWYDSLTDHVREERGAGVSLGATGLRLRNVPEWRQLLQIWHQGDYTLVFYGEIVNTDEFPDLCESSEKTEYAELLLNGFLRDGKAFFAKVEGRFQAAIWDNRNQLLHLVNDSFSSRTLYWAQPKPDVFLFASELKPLLDQPQIVRKLKYRTLLEIEFFGHYVHDDTAFESILSLPPSSFYTYDLKSGKLKQDKYYAFPFYREHSDVTVEDVVEMFGKAVQQQTRNVPNLGLGLTGALDSRCILGAMDPDQREVTYTVTQGLARGRNIHVASKLAALAYTQHYNYILSQKDLDTMESDFWEHTIACEAGFVLAEPVIPMVHFCRDLGIQTLLLGHGGVLFHLIANSVELRTAADFLAFSGPQSPELRKRLCDWFFNSFHGFLQKQTSQSFFTGMTQERKMEALQQSFHKLMMNAGLEQNEDVLQTLWHLYLNMRIYRRHSYIARVVDSLINLRCPFLNRRLIEMLFQLPAVEKIDERLPKRLLERYAPEFLKIPNVLTGASVGSGPFQRKLAKMKNSLFHKLGIFGYRNPNDWIQKSWPAMEPLVQKYGLSKDFINRGLINYDTVHEILQEHSKHFNQLFVVAGLVQTAMVLQYLDY